MTDTSKIAPSKTLPPLPSRVCEVCWSSFGIELFHPQRLQRKTSRCVSAALDSAEELPIATLGTMAQTGSDCLGGHA